MALTLLQGPAGSGKSQLVQSMIADGAADVQADVTALWAALTGAERDEHGKFPIRRADDPALPLARITKAVVVRQGIRQGLRVVVTAGVPGQAPRWQNVADAEGEDEFSVLTEDPGRETVERRLEDPETGELSPECRRAVSRWYGGRRR